MRSTELSPSALSKLTNSSDKGSLALWLLPASILLLIICFQGGLMDMVGTWGRDEYSHGYMIPAVMLFLMLQKAPEMNLLRIEQGFRGQWLGIVPLVAGLCLFFLGELSSLFTIIQYGFLVSLAALFVCYFGSNGARLLAVPLAYSVFMIPLPNFIYFNLSSELQLISSTIGVAVIRLLNISVFLEGNVIDLGSYQLQVVDACSGLRYLFPLMSFGFLVAYLFKAPLWQRITLFLTTIPITVFMNSFRIGVIGITVNYWGIAAAEGFLHDFEGWIVFIACLGILSIEMYILHRISKTDLKLLDRIDLNLPDNALLTAREALSGKKYQALLLAIALIIAIIPATQLIVTREEAVPARLDFNTLPLIKGKWFGRDSQLDAEVVDELDFSDYLIADYRNIDTGVPVNFYVAYYNTQRKGASIHSPRACLPGGGWQVKESGVVTLDQVPTHASQLLRVNRVLIEKGNERNLVYYWFQQRGRIITNEFAAKWYIFWDSLTRNRTDGALIRVISNVPEGVEVSTADLQLQEFLTDFNPLLADYIPD